MIEKMLKDNIGVLLDGAFGTYFLSCFNNDYPCELANILAPKNVEKIHREYVDAGSNLILSNTFFANRFNGGIGENQLGQIISDGFRIAQRAAGDRAFVGASIGPIPYLNNKDVEILYKERYSSLKTVVDNFLSVGADIFVFETWADTELLKDIISYIRANNDKAFIICSFAVMQGGYTREGQSLQSLIIKADKLGSDVLGLNCACGPVHMLELIGIVKKYTKKPVIAMPNAGYPYIENGRTIYPAGTDYFGNAALRFKKAGVDFIGGCCGTTPQHIKAMGDVLHGQKVKISRKQRYFTFDNSSKGRFTKPISVELDPPTNGSINSMKKKARALADMGVSMITLADSPLSRPRTNSIMLASVLMDYAGIPVMPHLCCRDRNSLALHSDITGAHALGIRDMLCVTGDPVSAGILDEVKSVFDMNSVGLLSLVNGLNETAFKNNNIVLSAAFNPGRKNLEVESKRIKRKFDAGAVNFYSQPIYSESVAKSFCDISFPKGANKYFGIMPPVSLRNALFLANEVPGIVMEDGFAQMFTEDMKREQAEIISASWAVNMIRTYERSFFGLYIVAPFNRISIIERILKRI